MYKVLWFDDEEATLELIKQDALLNDIQLIGYTNAEDGLKELLNPDNHFDAVLLDGLFFKSENPSKDDVDDEAFGEVAKTLGLLKANNIIMPWFIYSGQPKFVKDNNKMVNLFKDQAYAQGKIFDKNKDDDFIELCVEIKKAADLNPITLVRHNNPEIMDIFKLGYLPNSIEENIIDLLIKPLPTNNSEMKAILTNIRSIHESCLIKLEAIKVIPNAKDSFRNILKHLAGNASYQSNWKPESEVYITEDIKNLHEWIYHTCGTYIHYLEDQHHDGYMISNYAVESLR